MQNDVLPWSMVHCASVHGSANLARLSAMETHAGCPFTETVHRHGPPNRVSPHGISVHSASSGQAAHVPDRHAWPRLQLQLPPQSSGKLHGLSVQSGMQHRPERHVPPLPHGVPSGFFSRHLPFLHRLHGPHFFLHFLAAALS